LGRSGDSLDKIMAESERSAASGWQIGNFCRPSFRFSCYESAGIAKIADEKRVVEASMIVRQFARPQIASAAGVFFWLDCE
jgi:hypothetical protein